MEELKRPEIVDVEEYFTEFVEFYGGQVVSKLEQNLIDRPNADYLFNKKSVVAELKCFKKDLFNNESDIPRIFDFFYDWEKRKLITQADKIKLIWGTKQLPHECFLDMLAAFRKTIDRTLQKANKQIRETKKTFSIPSAKGIVLLANDGNYFLQNDGFLGVIVDLMHKKYSNSEIDCFVYFTVNQVARIPNSDLDWHLWVPGYRNENDIELSEFINDLGYKFQNDYYTKKTGIQSSDKIITDDDEKAVEIITSMKHIPKNIIYKKN